MSLARKVPVPYDDCVMIAEAIVDRMEFSDVYRLIEGPARDLLEHVIARGNACLNRLQPLLRAFEKLGRFANEESGLTADQQLRKLVADALDECEIAAQ